MAGMETDVSAEDSSSCVFQARSTCARVLTAEEANKLAKDKTLVSDFKQNKLEKEAQKNWDLFYKRNTTKFFKDRHWTTREFTDLCGDKVGCRDRLVGLEVGCGVGNFIFPLLAEVDNLFFYACDFSPRAVQFVKDSPSFDAERCYVFQNDLTKDALTHHVAPHSVDVVTMIFVLSAVNPSRMVDALRNIHTVLKPEGCVLIRDYGLYDHAMLRFAPGHKLSENFYVRQDGTRAYYFSQEKLSSLFHEAGFTTKRSDYILRETVNKKEGLCVPRVFIQAKFITSCDTASHNTNDNSVTVTQDMTDEGVTLSGDKHSNYPQQPASQNDQICASNNSNTFVDQTCLCTNTESAETLTCEIHSDCQGLHSPGGSSDVCSEGALMDKLHISEGS